MRNQIEDRDFLLWQSMFNTVTMIGKLRTRELKKYQISTNTAAILDCVKSSDNSATPSQIARWLIREPQSVSGILNRMGKRGMIKKSQDPVRKNVVRVSLTKKGEETYAKVLKRKSIRSIMASLSEEESQQLAQCLKKIQSKVITKMKK